MHNTLQHKTLDARIYSLRFWIKVIQPDKLKTEIDLVLKKTNFKVLSFSEHFFPIQGYTAIWLLAESHLAIHTFPQKGWTYVELSGCNSEKTEAFKLIIQNSGREITWDTESTIVSVPFLSDE